MRLFHLAVTLLATLPLSAAGFDADVESYLTTHCVRCHNEKKAKGEFRLDTLPRNIAGGEATMKWAEVAERISGGEMPPKAEPQPATTDSAKVVEYLSSQLREAEAARLAKRQRVSFLKLTRDEYAATIRDLLGVTFDAADPNGLPDDPEWNGFRRLGAVQSLAPSHVEKYFTAAETVMAEAFPDKVPEKFVKRRDAIDLRGGPDRASLTALGLADKVRVDLWPGADLQGGRIGPGMALPAAGHYKVRIQLNGLKPKDGRAPHLTFYATNLDRMLHEVDVIAAEDTPTVIEFLVHLPVGQPNLRLTNDVPGPSNLPRSGRADPRKPFISLKDGRRPWQIKLTDESGEPLMPFLILDWIEWEGPFREPGPTYAQREYLSKDAKNPAELRAYLAKFMTRAFRRPLHDGEVEKYTKLVEAEVKSGEPFASAFKTGLVAVLCSKDFLYVVEGSPVAAMPMLNDHELATRLSYFLWGSQPDDELRAAADAKTLHQTEVLRSQFRRMLKHPKAAAFAEAFPQQWLQLHRVGMFPPDKKLYPDYDDYLQRCMIRETTAYFEEMLTENLSQREFLDSNWTMLNNRLAAHYGIPGVEGDAFRRVVLQPNDHRGGLLTHAAVLSLTSDGTRHRPVHRGRWLMEAILGKSPPPPPANVKPIEPTPPTQAKETIRMKLARHAGDASCAACHAKIDPLGLAFDYYDAIGRWRTEEAMSDGSGANPKVDASGRLVDGRVFANPSEFKKLLLTDIDRFHAAFLDKLATFALRRTTTLADRDSLAKIAAIGKRADYRLQDTIEAFVLSDLFQRR